MGTWDSFLPALFGKATWMAHCAFYQKGRALAYALRAVRPAALISFRLRRFLDLGASPQTLTSFLKKAGPKTFTRFAFWSYLI